VNQMVPEVVRIGVGNARIKCVTPQRVEYFDEAGQECFVDLEECARNWVQSRGADRGRKYRYVAGRGMIEHPHWLEFTNKRRTRLGFQSSVVYTCCSSEEARTSSEAYTCCFSGEARRLKHLLFEARWITEDWL
jgi:hypothetical protein